MQTPVTRKALEDAMRDSRCKGSLDDALNGPLGRALSIALANTARTAAARAQSRSRVIKFDARRAASGDND